MFAAFFLVFCLWDLLPAASIRNYRTADDELFGVLFNKHGCGVWRRKMNERRHALDKKKRMNATTVVATLHYDYLGTPKTECANTAMSAEVSI